MVQAGVEIDHGVPGGLLRRRTSLARLNCGDIVRDPLKS